MTNLLGLIFAYNKDLRMRELIEHRTVSSIPFGGRYRVIDFMISNMVNADICDVGVIMRESYQSLLDHLGAGKDWDLARKRGGLRLLPPFGYAGVRESYRGKMEALHHIGTYLQYARHEHIVMADCDLIANLPLDEIFEYHLRHGWDITCVCSPKPVGIIESETYLVKGRRERVEEVIIGRTEWGAVEFLGVSIISRKLLLSLVSHCAAHNLHNYDRDVLQGMTDKLNIGIYSFDGYVAKLQTTSGYFAHSMELLQPHVRAELFLKSRPIKTKIRDEASTYYGRGSTVKNCIVADGCQIEGHVENSVIFRGVRIGKGATVKNSILMQDTVVGEKAVLNYAIADKNVRVNESRSLMGHANYPITIGKDSIV